MGSFFSIGPLSHSLKLAMSLHRSIIARGTSIIDKQDIRTMRNHRVVVMQQGPDLQLFSHPGVLSRLALWLVDALRDKLPGTNVSTRTKRKSLPFVVACLNEISHSYVVVGVMAALDFGDVRKKYVFSWFFWSLSHRGSDCRTLIANLALPSLMQRKGVTRVHGIVLLTPVFWRLMRQT